MLKILKILSLLILFLSISCSEQPLSYDENETDEKNETNDETTIVTDVDNNVYKAIKIGNQIWMAENLKVTRFQNGEPIANIEDNDTWKNFSTSAYCNFQNKDNIDNNGLLYNWYAVNDSLNIAPIGWHVASDDEWKELEMYLGMNESEVDYTGFRGIDEGSQIKDGDFGGLISGYREIDGTFSDNGSQGYWWTATVFCSLNAWNRGLTSESNMVYRNFISKNYGFFVRCVKD